MYSQNWTKCPGSSKKSAKAVTSEVLERNRTFHRHERNEADAASRRPGPSENRTACFVVRDRGRASAGLCLLRGRVLIVAVGQRLRPKSQLFSYSSSIVPKWRKGHSEITMAALLIGYAVAIAIIFFASRPVSINRPRQQAQFTTCNAKLGRWSERWQKPINW
jgi:hypothetical protein